LVGPAGVARSATPNASYQHNTELARLFRLPGLRGERR